MLSVATLAQRTSDPRRAQARTTQLDGATEMPCAGRCDEPVPVLQGNRYLLATPGEQLQEQPAPLPAPNPSGRGSWRAMSNRTSL